jgi:hypothetical protein
MEWVGGRCKTLTRTKKRNIHQLNPLYLHLTVVISEQPKVQSVLLDVRSVVTAVKYQTSPKLTNSRLAARITDDELEGPVPLTQLPFSRNTFLRIASAFPVYESTYRMLMRGHRAIFTRLDLNNGGDGGGSGTGGDRIGEY